MRAYDYFFFLIMMRTSAKAPPPPRITDPTTIAITASVVNLFLFEGFGLSPVGVSVSVLSDDPE